MEDVFNFGHVYDANVSMRGYARVSTGTCRGQKSVSGFLEVTCQTIVCCLVCIPGKELRSPAGALRAPNHRASFLTPSRCFSPRFCLSLWKSSYPCAGRFFHLLLFKMFFQIPLLCFLRSPPESCSICKLQFYPPAILTSSSYSGLTRYLCGHFLDNTWPARVQGDEEDGSQDRGSGRSKPVLTTLVLLSEGVFLCSI